MDEKYNKILKFSPYREKIYEELKSAIMNNAFEPNAVLNEREIAEKMGISRTPIRDALKLLESEGWVTTIPWKGTYVSELKKEDVREVIQLRKALEIMAIELIEKVSNEDLNNLQIILDQMNYYSKIGDSSQFMNEDRRFHLYIANLCGNSRLLQIVSNQSDLIYRIGIRAISLEGRSFHSTEEHQKVFDALSCGDIETAKECLRVHLENTEKTIFAVLDKQNGVGKDG